jgi:heptosyltransferase I
MQKNETVDTLLVRMDKIGDLVVSLNADQHPALTAKACGWLITSGLAWVVEQSKPRKFFIEADRKFSIGGFFRLVRTIKSLAPKRAIVFQAPWFVGLALWWAGVPTRVGRLSQWHSFLFFNHGVRQKRSLSDRHESQYNWDLISEGLAVDGGTQALPPPRLEAPTRPLPASLQERRYCVVHPGMMGSALNWPVESYIELIQNLKSIITVVITGTAADRVWIEPIQNHFQNESQLIWLNEKLSPQDLLCVLKSAQFVVAPSTGVIHLAAALGTPVVGFYSPRPTEKATRWGPLTLKSLIFTPDQSVGTHADTMKTISVKTVFQSIEREFL